MRGTTNDDDDDDRDDNAVVFDVDDFCSGRDFFFLIGFGFSIRNKFRVVLVNGGGWVERRKMVNLFVRLPGLLLLSLGFETIRVFTPSPCRNDIS